jgi:uncharacterized protein YkwD
MVGKRIGFALAAGLAAAALAAPGTASAKGQCLFQDEQARDGNVVDLERSLLCLTNAHRLSNGVGVVLRDTRLAAAARAHSNDMANRHFFDHTTPEGVSAGARAAAVGYPGGVSENIATNGAGTARSLFEQWRASTAGHNENMLRPDWEATGNGIDPRFALSGAAGITGTQMFGFAPADTKDDALDLYASSGKCAKAKRSRLNKKRKLKKSKGAARARLKVQLKALRKRIDKRCDDPPGAKK